MSELFTENIWCPICGSNHRRRLYPIDEVYAERISGYSLAAESIGVVACGDCGHEYIYQVPSAKFLCSFYSNYMSTAKTGFYSDRALEDVPANFRARYQPWLSLIKKWVQPGARLLDIGAGLGMFLKLAREQGYEVSAVEPNEESTKVLEEHYGIPMQSCLFEQAVSEDQVNVLTMWDLLEHLIDPAGSLQKANSLLAEGGILALEIPARYSLMHYLAKALYRHSFGWIRRPLYLVCGVHHLHYFTEAVIRALLKKQGFETLEVHHGDTELSAFYRSVSGARQRRAWAYNAALATVFGTARLLGMQKNLIIFARKES